MNCNGLQILSFESMQENIHEGVERAKKEMDQFWILDIIDHRYEITSISYAGSGFYDKGGRYTDTGNYKYLVNYTDGMFHYYTLLN